MKSVEPVCPRCGRNFGSEADLYEHIKTCKGGSEPQVRANQQNARKS
jgi:hypothetical protein